MIGGDLTTSSTLTLLLLLADKIFAKINKSHNKVYIISLGTQLPCSYVVNNTLTSEPSKRLDISGSAALLCVLHVLDTTVIYGRGYRKVITSEISYPV